MLAVGAFSGDSVPIHLLTLEAFTQYFRHLQPDGVLAVHITNRFLDLRPVVKAAANHFGKEVRLIESFADPDKQTYHSVWALITSDSRFFQHPSLAMATTLEPRAGFKPWKDDYSSILSVLQ